jgi:hypothetical protein
MHSYAEHVIPKLMGKLIKKDIVKYSIILIFIDHVLVPEIELSSSSLLKFYLKHSSCSSDQIRECRRQCGAGLVSTQGFFFLVCFYMEKQY